MPFPTPAGFLHVDVGWQANYPGHDAVAYDDRGGVLAATALEWRWFTSSPWAVAPEPDGGAVVVVQTRGCDSNVAGLHALKLHADSTVAVPAWPVVMRLFQIPEEVPTSFDSAMTDGVAAGVDGQGRILIVWSGERTCGPGTLAGRWFDPEGAPLSSVFLAGSEVHALPSRLQRLADGSLALQSEDGAWTRRFADAIPAGGSPPAWLTARPNWDVQLVRGGTAYAAIPPDVACNPRIELLSPDGAVCETLAYPALPGGPPPASWCAYPPGRLWSLSIGLDGTVSRLADERLCSNPVDPTFPAVCCTYEWWTRDLQ